MESERRERHERIKDSDVAAENPPAGISELPAGNLKYPGQVVRFLHGLLTLVLAGFWIHHCILGNRDNVILLSISLAVCMGIPILLQTTGFLLRVLAEKI